jgi:hypothetical protein
VNPSPLAAVRDAQLLLLRSGRVGMAAAVLEQLPSLISLALAAAETAAYGEGYATAECELAKPQRPGTPKRQPKGASASARAAGESCGRPWADEPRRGEAPRVRRSHGRGDGWG